MKIRSKTLNQTHILKNLPLIIMFSFSIVCFINCSEEEVCTICTETHTIVTFDYCNTESNVEAFEVETVLDGNSIGLTWICERQ